MTKSDRKSRRFARYKVADYPALLARIDTNRDEEHIVEISIGGCSFYGYEKAWLLSENKRVFSTFKIKDNPKIAQVTVQGNILKVHNTVLSGKDVVFYAIQFLKSEQAKLVPIMTLLEALRKQGKISVT